jgi:hypothetical protein
MINTYDYVNVILLRISKWVLQPQKSALRFFSGKCLQKFGKDLASPHTAKVGVAHG